MLNKVTVTITSRIVGEALIYPYQREGLPDVVPLYVVPAYAVTIDDRWFFAAIRFGLSPLIVPYPRERICSVGIASSRTVFPTFVAGYSPHSFPGGETRGAWRLLPGKQFLIHEGPDSIEKQGKAGSLGCVEIAKDNWETFMRVLLTATGAHTYSDVAQKKLLKVIIQATADPMGKYAYAYNVLSGQTYGKAEWTNSRQ